MKYLSLNFYSEKDAKVYFEKYHGHEIEWKDCQRFCKPGKYFENSDSYYLCKQAYVALYMAYAELSSEYNLKSFMLAVNSLYRKPFSIVQGKLDLLDLTTLYSHSLGNSIDFDFKMFEKDTGLNRQILIDKLIKHGFHFPFRTYIKDDPNDEYWHASLTSDML